eukprot:TRINITY_DN3849_c0_g3_i2.p1 TRINITY_DN3849_c0_g3~~TRINITY_DN3849_c0_g3_i2.p1  ORF type:complete len:2329 (+),score=68.01 TRINITY_DN3849_c0_g3_i2:51-7037(+)
MRPCLMRHGLLSLSACAAWAFQHALAVNCHSDIDCPWNWACIGEYDSSKPHSCSSLVCRERTGVGSACGFGSGPNGQCQHPGCSHGLVCQCNTPDSCSCVRQDAVCEQDSDCLGSDYCAYPEVASGEMCNTTGPKVCRMRSVLRERCGSMPARDVAGCRPIRCKNHEHCARNDDEFGLCYGSLPHDPQQRMHCASDLNCEWYERCMGVFMPSLGECQMKCRAMLSEGAHCGKSVSDDCAEVPCLPGLTCSALGSCVKQASCTASADCPADHVCQVAHDISNPEKCLSATVCSPLGKAGEECAVDTSLPACAVRGCKAGLVCERGLCVDDATTTNCQNDWGCRWDEYCAFADTDIHCAAGMCVAKGRLHEPCAATPPAGCIGMRTRQCVAGLECRVVGLANKGTCELLNGCMNDSHCPGGYSCHAMQSVHDKDKCDTEDFKLCHKLAKVREFCMDQTCGPRCGPGLECNALLQTCVESHSYASTSAPPANTDFPTLGPGGTHVAVRRTKECPKFYLSAGDSGMCIVDTNYAIIVFRIDLEVRTSLGGILDSAFSIELGGWQYKNEGVDSGEPYYVPLPEPEKFLPRAARPHNGPKHCVDCVVMLIYNDNSVLAFEGVGWKIEYDELVPKASAFSPSETLTSSTSVITTAPPAMSSATPTTASAEGDATTTTTEVIVAPPKPCENDGDCAYDEACWFPTSDNLTDTNCSSMLMCVPRVGLGDACGQLITNVAMCGIRWCKLGLVCSYHFTGAVYSRVCKEPVPCAGSDSDCGSDASCRRTLKADSGQCDASMACLPQVLEGVTCREDCGPACSTGLTCMVEQGAVFGTCKPEKADGTVCLTEMDCEIGEICIPAKRTDGVCEGFSICQAGMAEGAACNEAAAISPCMQQRCAHGLQCKDNVCTAEMEPCGNNGCPEGARCLPAAAANGSCLFDTRVCVPDLRDGDACKPVPSIPSSSCDPVCGSGLACLLSPANASVTLCRPQSSAYVCSDDTSCQRDEYCVAATNPKPQGQLDVCLEHRECRKRARQGDVCKASADPHQPCDMVKCIAGFSCVTFPHDTFGMCNPLRKCVTDSDCSESGWDCQEQPDPEDPSTCTDVRACTPPSEEGEVCGYPPEPTLGCWARRCAKGLVCVLADPGSTERKCAPEASFVDSPCQTDLDCRDTEVCRPARHPDGTECLIQKDCIPLAQKDEICGGDMLDCHAVPCAAGFRCTAGGQTGEYATFTCKPVQQCIDTLGCNVGEACIPAIDSSVPATCSPTARVCVARAGHGERCGGGASCFYRECGDGLRCHKAVVTSPHGLCIYDNEPDRGCTGDWDCTDAMVCIRKPNPSIDGPPCLQDKTCTQRAGLGQICSGVRLSDCNVRPCEEGLRCLPSPTDTNISVCVEPRPCVHFGDCAEDEVCIKARNYEAKRDVACAEHHVCMKKVGPGAPCDGYAKRPACDVLTCQDGLTCVHKENVTNTDEDIGTCHVNAHWCDDDSDCGMSSQCVPAADRDDPEKCLDHKVCVKKGGIGEACGPEASTCFFQNCAEGLTCVYSGSASATPGVGNCTVQVAAALCESASDCDETETCLPIRRANAKPGESRCLSHSVCTPRAHEGQECAGLNMANPCLYSRCAPGLYCAINAAYADQADAVGVCVSEKSAVTCASDVECRGDEFCKVVSDPWDTRKCLTYSVCWPRSRQGDSCGQEQNACMKRLCGAGLLCDRASGATLGKCVADTCQENAECQRGQACLPRCGLEEKVCKPRVGEFMRCEGDVPACSMDVCEEGLRCYYPTSDGHDPGYCLAKDVEFCSPGETKRLDTCNTCSCMPLDSDVGVWLCSDVLCQYNCFTRDEWAPAKRKWCCEKVSLGCFDCDWSDTTELPWTQEQEDYCCAREGVRCKTARALTDAEICQHPYQEQRADPACCWRYGHGCKRAVYDCLGEDPVQSAYELTWCCSERNFCSYQCDRATLSDSPPLIQDMCCKERGVCAEGWFAETTGPGASTVVWPANPSASRRVRLMVQWPAADVLSNPMFVLRKLRRAVQETAKGRLRPNHVVIRQIGVFMAEGRLPPPDVAEQWVVDVPLRVNGVLAAEEGHFNFPYDDSGYRGLGVGISNPMARYEPTAPFEIWMETDLTTDDPEGDALLERVQDDLEVLYKGVKTLTEFFLPMKKMKAPPEVHSATEQAGGGGTDTVLVASLTTSAVLCCCLAGFQCLRRANDERYNHGSYAPCTPSPISDKIVYDHPHGTARCTECSDSMTVPLTAAQAPSPQTTAHADTSIHSPFALLARDDIAAMALELRQVVSEGTFTNEEDTYRHHAPIDTVGTSDEPHSASVATICCTDSRSAEKVKR